MSNFQHLFSEEIILENKTKYSDIEYLTRVKLAASFRLAAQFGWDEILNSHFTAKIPGTDHLIINPLGIGFSEITATSLLKIDFDGNIIDQGTTPLGLCPSVYVAHVAIHSSRPEIFSTMHSHNNDVVAVCSYKDGLLPINQNSMFMGKISYHNYEGIPPKGEKERISKSLGNENRVLVLRNHGVVTCGSTIEECFFYLYEFTKSSEIQVKMLSMSGGDVSKLSIPTDEMKEEVLQSEQSSTRSKGFGKLEFKSLYRQIEKIDDSFKN